MEKLDKVVVNRVFGEAVAVEDGGDGDVDLESFVRDLLGSAVFGRGVEARRRDGAGGVDTGAVGTCAGGRVVLVRGSVLVFCERVGG